MSITTVHSILSNHASYPAASSGGIYSYIAKEGVSKPYTILFADTSEPIQSQGNAAGKEWKGIIVGCYAPDTVTAKSLASAARSVLDNYKGTIDGTKIEYCKYEGVELEDYDRDLKKAVVEIRFRLCYNLV